MEPVQKTQPPETIIHSFSSEPTSTLDGPTTPHEIAIKHIVLIFVLAVLLGGLSGFGLTTFAGGKTKTSDTGTSTKTSDSNAKQSAGIVDKKTFPDKVEGLLKEGGIDGEGTFHLERPGGEDQNVYLTSSTVDMSSYVNKKVRVWGQTFQGQKAGWLMDVGYIEVL